VDLITMRRIPAGKGAAVAGRPFRRRSCLVQAMLAATRRRRMAAPVRPKPAISIAQLAGSGTVAPTLSKTKLSAWIKPSMQS
jgi:hypothetical protein